MRLCRKCFQVEATLQSLTAAEVLLPALSFCRHTVLCYFDPLPSLYRTFILRQNCLFFPRLHDEYRGVLDIMAGGLQSLHVLALLSLDIARLICHEAGAIAN
jgi:hypothetical protein